MRIDHAALYVLDLERAREFFEVYFGGAAGQMYHNPNTGLHSYFLTFDGGARLELMTRPKLGERPDSLAAGWDHVAFSVGSAAGVDELTERLARDGYRVVSGPRTTGDGYYESVVLDAEGNQIEITI